MYVTVMDLNIKLLFITVFIVQLISFAGGVERKDAIYVFTET